MAKKKKEKEKKRVWLHILRYLFLNTVFNQKKVPFLYTFYGNWFSFHSHKSAWDNSATVLDMTEALR